MKTKLFKASKESINADDVMTVIITDSENVKREYGIKAIDIVKEHKCIWKGVYNHSQESTQYTLSCGNSYFDEYLGEDVECFKYCPYCGGEVGFNEVKL